MADCNKTVDFLRTLKRYCAEQRCYDCPICQPVGAICIASVGEPGLEHAETIIPALQLWADAHPAETWLKRLKKALPECELASIVSPHCPGDFFSDGPGRENCPEPDMDCAECWSKETHG